MDTPRPWASRSGPFACAQRRARRRDPIDVQTGQRDDLRPRSLWSGERPHYRRERSMYLRIVKGVVQAGQIEELAKRWEANVGARITQQPGFHYAYFVG